MKLAAYLLIFRSRLTRVQWAGVALVAAGSALATLGGPVSGGNAAAGQATQMEQPTGKDSTYRTPKHSEDGQRQGNL